ncbi:MAG TPA: phenylalanine--tRNA ligase subunit beta, partial [Rhodocyclaceae bacterium]|nr:phenylalanine--tRNA ligase subunit beta [Rhodocyclaceae bacterium]
RVLEIGRVFLRDVNGQPVAGYSQPERLAGAAYGEREPEQWGVEAVGVDFFDVKADIEAMFAPRAVVCEPLAHPLLHPGRAARVRVAGEDVGVIGELHPNWVRFFDLGRPAIVFELDLASLRARDLPHFHEVSMFQAVRRDLALIVGDEVPAEHVRKALQNAAPHYVKEVELFDLYRGPGLSENEKSLAFRIVMQDNQRTLEDSDADQAVAALVDAVRGQFGARLR